MYIISVQRCIELFDLDYEEIKELAIKRWYQIAYCNELNYTHVNTAVFSDLAPLTELLSSLMWF